jgi:glycosyltransferase involved in cell wall biosynthesis
MFESAGAIVAVSRDMERQLRALGACEAKLHYNPYGVDLSRFVRSDRPADRPLFVAVGRFVEKKAPHLTLTAFARVVEEIPEARLVMLGDGPLLSACRDLARGLGISDAVEFRGAVTHEAVAAAMGRGRAFVQHSIQAEDGDSEGTPVAVLEAQASGLPVVATRVAGIGDVVVEGQTGYLLDPYDVDGMAGHMLRLAHDGAMARRLGEAGRRRVAERFTLERHIEMLWQILRSAIRNRDRSAEG